MPYGSIYTRKAQTKVHRHGFDMTGSIAANTADYITLLQYTDQAQSPITGTTDQFGQMYVSDGSVVNKYWLDMTISPTSTSKTYDLYIGWIALSMDEILSIPDTDLSLAKDSDNKINPTSHSFSMSAFRLNPKNKHFVKGMKKVTLYSGRPATVSKWLRVPPKIKRGQEGQYWCLFIANATSNTSGTDGTVNVSVSRVFNEFPLVD